MQKLYATTAEKGWKGNEISHWLANSHIDLQLRFCKPTNYIGKNCTIKTMFKREQQMHLNISTLKTSIKTKKHEIINQQNIGQYRSGHLIRPSRPSVFFFAALGLPWEPSQTWQCSPHPSEVRGHACLLKDEAKKNHGQYEELLGFTCYSVATLGWWASQGISDLAYI